jgi:hypothetical protein
MNRCDTDWARHSVENDSKTIHRCCTATDSALAKRNQQCMWL